MDFVLTYSGAVSNVEVYLVQGTNVSRQLGVTDAENAAVPTEVSGRPRYMLFMDDLVTSGEATPGGTVNLLKLWDRPLTQEQIQSALNSHSGVSPESGVVSGGYTVTIVGTNLCNGVDVTDVTLCGVSVQSITSQSATQIVVVASAGTPGLGDVRVFSTSFGETVRTNGFTYEKIDTTTVVVGTPNPASAVQSVTFTATVSPSAASGTVTFKDGTNTLGTGALSGGVATFATNGLSVGSHSLTATYGGDASYLASTSSVLTQVVNVAGAVWAGGATNDWRISDATGVAGTFPGWDCPAISGNLVITAASTNRFTLRVLSLTPPGTNNPGPMANFSQTTAYAWPIVAVSGAIIGFHPGKFTVDTNSLANALGGGTLAIAVSGSNLVLAFVPAANRPPVANPNTMTTVQNQPATIAHARLLANDTDPDGDLLSVTGVSAGSVSGGTIVSVGGNVTYTPLTNFVGSDSYTYSIADARGGVATATVTVTVSSGASQVQDIAYASGGVTVKFAGVPGWSYNVQRSTNSAGPWAVVHTTNAPATGLFTYTDNYPPSPTGYYRLAKNQ